MKWKELIFQLAYQRTENSALWSALRSQLRRSHSPGLGTIAKLFLSVLCCWINVSHLKKYFIYGKRKKIPECQVLTMRSIRQTAPTKWLKGLIYDPVLFFSIFWAACSILPNLQSGYIGWIQYGECHVGLKKHESWLSSATAFVWIFLYEERTCTSIASSHILIRK